MTRLISRSACLALVVLLLFPLVPAMPTAMDDDAGSGRDAGDSRSDAMPIEAGTYSGRAITGIDHTDWYAFDLEAGQGVHVTATRPMSLTGPEVANWDSGGQYAYATTNSTWYAFAYASVPYNPVSDYTFTLEVVELPPQDDGESGGDAGRTRIVELVSNSTGGHFNRYDVNDHYRFEATAGETFTVTVAWADRTGGPYFGVWAPYPNYPEWLSQDGQSTTYRARYTGAHTLDVSTWASRGYGNYTIAIASNGGSAPEVPRPANDDRANATQVEAFPASYAVNTTAATTESSEYRGCGISATVWYTFTPAITGLISIDTTGSDFRTALGVYLDADTYPMACAGGSYYSPQAALVDVRVEAGRTYSVQAGSSYGAGGDLRVHFGELRPIPEIDLAVTIDEEVRRPIRTDFGEVPNLVNERRVIVATVTNDGPDASVGGYAALHRTAGHRSCNWYGATVGYASVPALAPGESVQIRIGWDTTAALGDQTLGLRVSGAGHFTELDLRDNLACLQTFVRVGGLGGFS